MNLDQKLARWFLEQHPEETTPVLLGLSVAAAVELLTGLPSASLGRAVLAMGSAQGSAVLGGLEPAQASKVVEALSAAAAAVLLRRLPPEQRAAILGGVSAASRRSLNALLVATEGSAGAFMETHVLALPRSLTIKEATRQVERSSNLRIHCVYVINEEHHLMGALDLRGLLLGKPQQLLEELMVDPIAIPASLDVRQVLTHPGWYQANELPVVDNSGVLLGVMTSQILRHIEHELAAPDQEQNAGDVTVAALGDLFWTGISGLVGAVGSTAGKRQR